VTDLSAVSQLLVAVARRVDQVCDQFETAWNAAASAEQRPRIEDYLVRLPESERSALLRDLKIPLDSYLAWAAGKRSDTPGTVHLPYHIIPLEAVPRRVYSPRSVLELKVPVPVPPPVTPWNRPVPPVKIKVTFRAKIFGLSVADFW
jgi:hypothetical protein